MVRMTASNQTIRIVICVVVLFILMLCGILVAQLWITRDYAKTEGKIVDIYSAVDLGLQNGSRSTRYKYMRVEYEVDSVQYSTEYRINFKIGKHIGQSVNVYYNPQNPSVVRNRFLISSCILGICFCSLFLMLLLFAKCKTSKQ